MHLLHFVTGVVDDLDAAPPVAAGFVESPSFRGKKGSRLSWKKRKSRRE